MKTSSSEQQLLTIDKKKKKERKIKTSKDERLIFEIYVTDVIMHT